MKATQTLIVLLSWAAFTAGAAQKSAPKNEDDVMLLDGPNFVLPSRVGLFQRSEVKTFDKSGRDVGVGYDLDHLIKGDVYVYPVGGPGYGKDLNSEFRVQQNAISQLNHNVRLISRETMQLNQDGHAIAGIHANYELRRDLFAELNLKCGSQLYVFRDGTWFVAYRFSYPRAKSAIALTHIRNFIAAWQWRQIPKRIP